MWTVQADNAKQGKTWGHIEVPADGLKTVSKTEFVSQETKSGHSSFIVDIYIRV